jgi:aspartyl-tRNA(Asn)/glutamyl-tRNA(Gln) amidotransferase subunit A
MTSTIKQLSILLAEGKASSVELCRDYLGRIQALNPRSTPSSPWTRTRPWPRPPPPTRAAPPARPAPLTGVPIAHKDIFCAEGWLTTCGSKMLSNFVSPYDAHVIEQFKAAGMPCLGKTNMDEFAMGSSNETSFFGPVKNPWDTARVPGGSSGGSAACVAARLAPAATGTDTGGSIRQPAALCGITGLKPTYGVVSRYGMIAFASSLDQAGPMAQTAEDCALLLNVMAGFDARDSTSLEREKEDYTRDLAKPLAGLRIGLPREFFGAGLTGDTAKAVEEAIAQYRGLGAETVEVGLPNSRLSVAAYYVLAPAEASSNLSRFDGVRYGYRTPEYKDLTDMYEKTRAEGFGAEVKRRIMIGTYVLSHGYYDAYYIQAQRLRRLIANDFAEAFKVCDVILGPTAPTTAFKLGEKADDPVQMYLSDIYTIAVNLAGLPGMSLPCGFDGQGLPIGLQLIGDYFGEAKMLNVAHQYQLATDWHTRAPKGI